MATRRQRRKKGRAHVTDLENGSQRVDVTYRGQRYRKVFTNAQAMAHTINASIARGEDISHYFLAANLAAKTKEELFQDFIEFKRRLGVKESTIKSSYLPVLSILSECPWLLDKPQWVRNWVINTKGPEMARTTLRLIGACCNWAGLDNPYSGYCKLIPRNEPKPTAIEGWDAAISGYEGRYSDLFRFLFLTGCRPSEALGLRYMDVNLSANSITFCGQWDGHQWTEGLKTQESRDFPLYAPLTQLVANLAAKPGIGDTDRLFPFNLPAVRKAFKRVFPDHDLKDTRKTFVTEQVIKGVSPDVIAQWCGNSAATIRKHYLDKIKLVEGQVPR
jgi:integrase